MTAKEIYGYLDRLYPSSLSCEWDNDGIMCLPDGNKKIKKILFALDVTDEAFEYAVNGKYDLIITHHPLIFNKLGEITDSLLLGLIKNDIAVISFHTRLDAAENGVNDCLASQLGLDVVARDFTEGLGIIVSGRGNNANEFAKEIKEKLSTPSVFVADGGKKAERIAILGGQSGKENLDDALKAGCDTYITGFVNYNSMIDAARCGLTVICAGHYYTERPVLTELKKKVYGLVGDGIKLTVFDSTPISVL